MRIIENGLNEGLADDISGKLLYSFFIDMYPIVNRRGGLLTIMFPNVGAKKLYRWLKGAEGSDLYTQNAQKMEDLYKKMSTVSSLKTLYRAVSVLKSKETSQEENETRINDLNLLMSKIERVIKSHLSNEEKQLFNSLSSILSPAANDAGKSIEGSVGASTQAPEQPVAEPTEKPEETPQKEPAGEKVQKTEEPPVQSTEEPTTTPAATAKPAPKAEPTPAATAKPAPKAEPTPAATAKPDPKAEPAPAKPESEKSEETSSEEETGKNESVIMKKYLKAIIREIVERKLGLR